MLVGFVFVAYLYGCFSIRNAKEINLESLHVMNVGLDKSNFRLDMGYHA